MVNQLIYIAFDDHFLFLSKLKEKKKKFFSLKSNHIPLNNLEIKNGILFNPSSLFLKIKKFLNENRIKNPRAIICIPSICTKKDLLEKFVTLQFALCASKSGLKIEKIISEPLLKRDEKMVFKNFFSKKELDTQLDFFKQFKASQNKHPARWFLVSAISIVILFVAFWKVNSFKNAQLTFLQNKNNMLQEKGSILENKIKTMQQIAQQNNILKAKIEKIEKIKSSGENPNDILLPITQTLPESCWLQRINIKGKKPNILEIEGFSNKEQDITELIQNLSKIPQISSLRLEKLEENKKDLSLAKYFFKLSGKTNL